MSAKVRGEFVSRNVVSKKWTFLLWIACFCLGMFFTNRMWVVPEANGSPRTSRKESEVQLFKSVSCNTKILVQHEGSNSSTQLSGTQDPLQILDKTISNLEMKLAEARTERESVMKGNALSSNSRIKESTRKKKYFMVIGINTAFSSRKRRDSIRATWMPQGEERKKLEERKGVVIRFVIGHSTTSGGVLDKTIDAEEKSHGDFMRLEHVEGYLELSAKTKTYFITAMSLWDAEFYVKVDDDVHVNLATLGMTLARHRKRPRIYIGCMKSGPVLARNGVKYHEPEYWKFGEVGNKYFRHATGQLYALSKDLVAYISVNQDVLHKYANEDVSLGSWLIGLDVEHVDDRRLCCGTPPDCEWKAQAGNVCVASFDWKCSGICRSVERMADVHERCGEEKNALWSREFSEVTSSSS